MTETALTYDLWIHSKATHPGVGVVVNFRKATPVRCRTVDEHHGPRVFTLMGDRQSRQLEIRFPKGQGPEDNTLIQVVWEFLENGQKHPKCWARLPDVGCFKDWSLMNSYACRAEWTGNDGDRCIQYIQRPNYLGMGSDNHNGSLTTYAWANALFRYFTRRVYTEDRRSLDISFGFARVKDNG